MIMNDIDRMNAFLTLIKNAALQGRDINYRLVYGTLTRFGRRVVNNEDINANFNDWIRYFENIPNIDVFVQDNWKYFCQFTNDRDYFDFSKMLKIYIPVDDLHINEAAKKIFKFMADNDIIHHSKIGSTVRVDDIVIRLTDKRDALKIRDFIMHDDYIKEGLMSANPFLFNDGILSYAWDGNESYNSALADLITMYINGLKKYNMLDSVSFNDFYIFVANTYKDVFENGNNLQEFWNAIDCDRNHDQALTLANYEGILNMMLFAMKDNSKDLNAFFQRFDKVKSSERMQKMTLRMQNFLDNPQHKTSITSKNNDDSEIKKYYSLWESIYPKLVHKYGYEEADLRLLRFCQTGEYTFFTRDGNVRGMVIDSKITPELLMQLMINMKRGKAGILHKASFDTLNKYDSVQICSALLSGQKGYYKEFTNPENRRKLSSNIMPGEVRGIITSSLLEMGYQISSLPDNYNDLVNLYVDALTIYKGYKRIG